MGGERGGPKNMPSVTRAMKVRIGIFCLEAGR
jgi:hypothetical protein